MRSNQNRFTFQTFIFFALLLGTTPESFAQQTVFTIGVDEKLQKPERVSIQVSNIQLHPSIRDTIGYLYGGKKGKSLIPVVQGLSFQEKLQVFLNKRFIAPANAPSVMMRISKLDVLNEAASDNQQMQTLIVNFEFLQVQNKDTTSLYTCYTKSPVSPAKDPDGMLRAYMTRSVTKAMHQFQEAVLRNPEWFVQIEEAKSVHVKVLHNRKTSGDTLLCQRETKLTAADFRGKIPVDSIAPEVISRTGITYKVSFTDPEIIVHTYAYFDRNRSWKKEQPSNPNWLAYQQVLLDICAKYGEQFARNVEKYSFSAGEYKGQLNQIYNEVLAEFYAEREQYIGETEKGINSKALIKWQQKAASWFD
jgi:hypothetical protein